MTGAYDKKYLTAATECMGEALDYALRSCEFDFGTFMDMFITGGFAARFENGDFSVILGMSGSEMVVRAIDAAGFRIKYPRAITEYEGLSYEYWCGMELAHFQWYSGRSFEDILKLADMDGFFGKVYEYSEMNEPERERLFDEVINGFDEPVRLQAARKRCGLSQKELAERSGVNLRTLQQYEIKSKDINKAAASTLKSLAKVLGCMPDDIMEYGCNVQKDNTEHTDNTDTTDEKTD